MKQRFLTIVAVTICAATHARARSPETPTQSGLEPDRRIAIQIDNDLFSGAHRDQDYTWGAAVTFASPESSRWFSPIDRMRRYLHARLAPGEADRPSWLPQESGVQIGLLAMTPSTLRSAAPLLEDRPFASLLFLTSAEVHVLEENPNRARFSSLTIGALGLDLARSLHARMHDLVDDEEPLGWNHQISAGGEPTMRYVQAEQWLFGDADSLQVGRPELKLTLAGSAGFLTEGSAAISARWGRIQSPWWTFNPELGDYTAAPIAPIPGVRTRGLSELFLFAGARVKVRAYNSLLQGQFRHSEVRAESDELARLPAEGWIGVASSWSGLRITYTIHYQSREITREPGARSMIWGGINFEKAF